MLRHVLVPLDGSNLSEQALFHAQEILAANGKITLLSVIEIPADYEYAIVDIPLTVMTGRAYTEEQYHSAYQRVQDYLNSNARKLRDQGYEVDVLVKSGDPATIISEAAQEQKVNAIVISTHGRTGLSRWLFGSVTQKVISQAIFPVLVVPRVETVKTDDAVAVPVATTIPATS